MRPIILAIAAAGVLVASGMVPTRAADVAVPPYGPYGGQSAPPPYAVEPAPGPYAVQPPVEMPVAEPTPYVYGGYSYCWFSAGWRGPGWYVCDRGPWVAGYWWGGPVGWRGWAWRGGPRFAAFRGPGFRGPWGYRGWHGGMHGHH
jgi:hypothetical protein